MAALMENTALWAALAGLVSAQLLKPLISILTGQGFRPYLFITTGGMPSSHTSAVSALTISVAMTEGLDSSTIQGAVRAIAEADTLIIGGTSLVVYPAAGFIDYFQGKHLVVINKSETGRAVRAELTISAPIGEILDRISVR